VWPRCWDLQGPRGLEQRNLRNLNPGDLKKGPNGGVSPTPQKNCSLKSVAKLDGKFSKLHPQRFFDKIHRLLFREEIDGYRQQTFRERTRDARLRTRVLKLQITVQTCTYQLKVLPGVNTLCKFCSVTRLL
jgi:hypothetical protein